MGVALTGNPIEDLFAIKRDTNETRQRRDILHIHLPNPKLTLRENIFNTQVEKNTFRLAYFGAVLFDNEPTSINEATSLSVFKNS